MYTASVHNTVIEGFWCWLRGKMGLKLKEFITRGKRDRVLIQTWHSMCPCFTGFLYLSFRSSWMSSGPGGTTIECISSATRICHLGTSRSWLLSILIILAELIAAFMFRKRQSLSFVNFLTEEVGSRKSHLSWPGVTLEFETMAQAIWEDIGDLVMSVDSAWNIFAQMSDVIENYD
ncbi:hypothetical protein B0H14DRAFT_2578790 [Mycena olivaceomarginata]|nr:hypothetical protein B0H14DRAFT_2578790 [Mycena olivaceomarginata]